MDSSVESPVIHVSAVVLRDALGRVLTVRKRGTERFMFPGGKPEPGESADAAALREVAEEIGMDLDPQRLRSLGDFLADAANEAGYAVAASVFTYGATATEASIEELAPAAEIDELRWVDVSGPWPMDLAPLLSDAVFPHLLRGVAQQDADRLHHLQSLIDTTEPDGEPAPATRTVEDPHAQL